MHIEIATLFPEMCEAVLGESIIGRARKAEKLSLHCRQIREYTQDKHRRVDDPPYGGGAKADANESFNGSRIGRFGGRFDKYLETKNPNQSSLADGSQSLNVERERERESLRGGGADFENRKRSRFGGRFDRYYIGGTDGRQVVNQISSGRCL